MSMRDYAVDDYGLLMTSETMKMVASKVCDDYTEEAYAEDVWSFHEELYDKGIVEYISSFSGESVVINDLGESVWCDGESYGDDVLYFVPTRRISMLFRAAYRDMNELIAEFKERLGEYLPDDFDYSKYIRHISGTYYG